MDKLKNAISTLQASLHTDISIDDLETNGLTALKPREYQLFGINWLLHCHNTSLQDGCIIGDEMGLGKTLQTVCFLMHMKASKKSDGPFLILSPLSVVDNWKNEIIKCAPSLRLVVYTGYKEAREELRETIGSQFLSSNWKNSKCNFDVLVTSYEVCMKDKEFFSKFSWKILVVDEAHRLKNSKSLLYQILTDFDFKFKLLLTGTPVQNNLEELYSLLHFIVPKIFKENYTDEFKAYFSNVAKDPNSNESVELHQILKPFLLRRVKNEVIKDLPKKTEVILYCGMSALQKKLYRGVLAKDVWHINEQGVGKKTKLLNILMQLRKCCNHPYNFTGVEPEPFQIGEHIVEASGKLMLLDKLLKYLKASNHKVLLFSQFTMMLDIIQDYLGYRGYTYERLDGSVRGEERFLAINNFNSSDETFVFLLSTKAGGVGLNLMSADTVIFVDNDFNPQNDLQAAARAHRIGQTRPVKVIRLLARNTVEEIILKRANNKLKLTNTVIEGGQFSNLKQDITTDNGELADILKYGLDDLLKSEEGSFEDENFKVILGGNENGIWEDNVVSEEKDRKAEKEERVDEDMYVYEGQDYKSIISEKDKTAFDELVADIMSKQATDERSSRKKEAPVLYSALDEVGARKRKLLTAEEKEEQRRKREESKAKRMKIAEEKRLARILKLWEDNDYTSMKLEIDSETGSSVSTEDEEDNECQIHYVVGDVTQPQCPIDTTEAVVVHCLDDSGYWGKGGLFTAINNRSDLPKAQYELAGRMKDLSLGDVHLVPMADDEDKSIYVALVVVHNRDKQNRLSPMFMDKLKEGLERIHHIAAKTGASVHFPRIGYNTPNFNWYGTEKLIKKMLTNRGIPTYIYYYKRNNMSKNVHPISTLKRSTEEQKTSTSDDEGGEDSAPDLPDIFSDVSVYFHQFNDKEEERRLSRFVVAYNGDVERYPSDSTTHIICEEREQELSFARGSSKVVHVSWLRACLSKSSLVDEEEYLIQTG